MQHRASLTTEYFGRVGDRYATRYNLHNRKGDIVSVTDYGVHLTRWLTRDRLGKPTSVVIGFDDAAAYARCSYYPGATVGRYANFIAHGEFKLAGIRHKLTQNYREHHLHGGYNGFDKQFWEVVDSDSNAPAVTFHYRSLHGEEGYPGNLDVFVRFKLDDDNTLTIEYKATTDLPTLVNLTNHSYFNLAGNRMIPITEHRLMIDADYYTPITEKIPTGALANVGGTPYDFRSLRPIGGFLREVGGYNHNYVLRKNRYDPISLAAVLEDLSSGIRLETYTTKPGLQLYTGNGGVCLETQYFPNSPNEEKFPSPVLRPNEQYEHMTKYRLSAIN